ncbi:hypothetical protein DM02DRAFT_658338 [Periconia macrospinosa]|uniref:Rhodopsin domain-containing protein n=1 Tax=Periconia macrospinosa TaxID=97972 RepID=A0A2V1DH23_9PLEO|nr:hypothetical protein DM02DRAFT_658338 [Periconia macrospinosa]
MAYDNPKGLIAAAVIGQALVYLFVALRFQTRYRHGRKFFYQWGTFLNGVVVTGLVKISVSFFYMQIFAVKYRHIVLPWLFLMIAWTVGFTILMLTFCGDHGVWPSIPLAKEKAQCLDGTKVGYAIVIGHAISDFFTVLLPLPMVVALRLPWKRKFAVMAIFAVGLLSVGGSVAKAYIYITSVLKKSSRDYATSITSISVWGLVESQVGIIAACIMTLRPLMKDASNSRIFSNMINSTRTLFGSRSGTTYASSSKTGFTKFSSDHPDGLRGGDANSQKDEETYVLQGYKTAPIPPGAIHVQKDVDVSNYSS